MLSESSPKAFRKAFRMNPKNCVLKFFSEMQLSDFGNFLSEKNNSFPKKNEIIYYFTINI